MPTKKFATDIFLLIDSTNHILSLKYSSFRTWSGFHKGWKLSVFHRDNSIQLCCMPTKKFCSQKTLQRLDPLLYALRCMPKILDYKKVRKGFVTNFIESTSGLGLFCNKDIHFYHCKWKLSGDLTQFFLCWSS